MQQEVWLHGQYPDAAARVPQDQEHIKVVLADMSSDSPGLPGCHKLDRSWFNVNI